MKFCQNCQNMLYISVSGDILFRKCKNCNFAIEENYAAGAECIVTNSVETDNDNYKKYMSKYIKYDPTLPRVNNIACPNASCSKKAADDNEVIYIKYDNKNLKFLYFCCHCENFWK